MAKKRKPTKDELDLVAAALGLKSSVWAKAVLHITPAKFNVAINGVQVTPDDDDTPPDDEAKP